MARPESPFRGYHRARWWMAVARIAAVGVSAVVAVGLVSLVAPAAPPVARDLTAAVASAAGEAGVGPAEPAPATSTRTEAARADLLPAPAGSTAASASNSASTATQPTLPTTGADSWAIAVDTRGYQAEIDECLWVRMDLGGQAPIVGAHNYCGGGIVLDMDLGDVVTMTGTELDGRYVVSDARDARAGDTAATAIAGMVGRVILQTCYWSDDGTVRLVGLTPAPVG